MTRRDFELIADAINEAKPADGMTPQEVWAGVVDSIGASLHADSGRFDFVRFEYACGVDEAEL